jgi:glycosyltransferase involved in cell wall biosynthesis
MTTLPKDTVSCIVPTRNRKAFIRSCLRLFDAQTYSNKELIIIDDSDVKNKYLSKLTKKRDDLIYVYLPKRAAPYSIGFKRNLAVLLSSGTVVLTWDDDDIHGRDRIRAQLSMLKRSKADAIVGRWCAYYDLTSKTMFDVPTHVGKQIWAHGYVGPTLMFYKHVWNRGVTYPPWSISEDREFIRRLQARKFKLKTVRLPPHIFLHVKHKRSTYVF